MAKSLLPEILAITFAVSMVRSGQNVVTKYQGEKTILQCGLAAISQPGWEGPPSLTLYYYENSGTLNPNINKSDRISRGSGGDTNLLVINPTILADKGTYQCYHGYDSGFDIYRIDLFVRIAPDPPEILETTIVDDMIVIQCKEDQTITMICVSRGGFPEPYLDLYEGTHNITSSRNVETHDDSTTTVTINSTITASRRTDRVRFTCKSSYESPALPKTTSVILYLSLKPSIPVISGNLIVTNGSQVQLQCLAAGSRPKGNISWTFNDITSVSSELSLYNDGSKTYTVISNLTTRQLHSEDNNKKIICSISHEALLSQLSVSKTLNIQFAPYTVRLTGNTVITANGDNTLVLTCITASANPVSNITWTHKTELIISVTGDIQTPGEYDGTVRQQQITVTPTRNMDGDAISCTAGHFLLPQSQQPTQNIKLDLTYKPIVTIQEGESISYTEGHTHEELHCGASSKPKSTFRWFHNNTVVSASQAAVETNEFIHMIEEVDRTHYGDYKCEANNSIDNGIDSIHVTVEFKPLQIQISGNKLTEANGVNQLPLTCETGTANPAATMLWLNYTTHLFKTGQFNINQIVEDDGQYGGKTSKQTLILVPTRFMDGSRIVCKGWNRINSQNPVSTEATLDINYEPLTTVSGGKEKNVTEGQTNVKLTCSAESKPPSSFIWFKTDSNNSLISGNGTISDNSFNITISSVNRTHAGEYMCTARNEIGVPHKSSIHLNVHYPPDVTVTTTNTTVNSTSIDIDCVAAGVPSNYLFYPWQHTWLGTNVIIRDQLLPRSTSQPSKQTLTIQSPGYQDTGVYTCIVENGVNLWDTDIQKKTGSVYLLVKSYPVITMPFHDVDEGAHKVSAQLNNKFTVTISFYSNAGGIKHKFYRLSNNTKVEVKDSMKVVSMADVILKVYETDVNTQGHTLTISHSITNADQFGSFYVDILNEMGIATVPLEIIPAGPPCTPEHVKIDERSETTIRLSWIRCFHGGFAQTFLVQYSKDGLTWTNGSFTEGGLSTSRARLNTTMNSLTPDTLYYLRVLAFNEQGISNVSTVLNKTTEKEELTGQPTTTKGASDKKLPWIIGGVVVLILGVIVTLIVYVVIRFRRVSAKRLQSSPMQNDYYNMTERNRSLAAVSDTGDGGFQTQRSECHTYEELSPERKQQAEYTSLNTPLENSDIRTDENSYEDFDYRLKKDHSQAASEQGVEETHAHESIVYGNLQLNT